MEGFGSRAGRLPLRYGDRSSVCTVQPDAGTELVRERASSALSTTDDVDPEPTDGYVQNWLPGTGTLPTKVEHNPINHPLLLSHFSLSHLKQSITQSHFPNLPQYHTLCCATQTVNIISF